MRADQRQTSGGPSRFPLRRGTACGSDSLLSGIGIGRSTNRCARAAGRVRGRIHGVGRPKKFAQIRAFGLLRAPKERFAATPLALPFIPQQASRRRVNAAPIANANASRRKRRRKKTALNAAFLIAACWRCESRRARVGAMRGGSASWRRERGRGGGENIFAKLLTHRKSVIRFRPSRRFLRKQVSRVIATISKTKRPPTRALGMTDAGFASPTKTQTPFPIPHPRRMRRGCFFIRADRREQARPFPAGLATIRSDAPGATAAACGSDSRGVPLQLGFVNGFTNP